MRPRQAHIISCGIVSIVELVCDQELINLARKDCRSSQARVADLALFSPNETLDDISTQDLVYLFVPHVSAEIETRARAIERDERLARLREAEVSLALPPSKTRPISENTFLL
jgi:TAP42-like family